MNWRLILAAGAMILFTGTLYAQENAPGGVSDGLALWLKADSGVINQDGFVSVWMDQSSYFRDASQTSLSLQPKLIEGALNGNPVVRFNVDSLLFDGSFLVGSSYTVIIVEARDRFGVANFFIGGSARMTNGNLVLGYENVTRLRQAHFANDLDAVVPAYTGIKEFALTTLAFNTEVGRSIFRHGELVAQDENLVPLVSNVDSALGSFAAYNFFYEGDIAEIIIYDKSLPCRERALVELYLASKYALQLTYDDLNTICAQEPITSLLGSVIALNLQQGIANSLDAKLDSALGSLEDTIAGNDVAALNKLQAFINAVLAQRGNKISEQDADLMIAKAEEVIDFLSDN